MNEKPEQTQNPTPVTAPESTPQPQTANQPDFPAAQEKVAPAASEPVVKEEKKSEKKEKKGKKKKNINLSRGDGGINLIPPLTESEVRTENRKFTINLSAAYTLLFLVVLSILVVGFNAYQRLSLNAEKERLFEVERQVNLRTDLMGYNDEIVRRIKLYQSIEETSYSTKEVVDYWERISEGLGEITSIELTSGLGFEVAGIAGSLSDVARIWYLLANDPHIESVTLDSVVRDGASARFSFEGRLNFSEFSSAR